MSRLIYLPELKSINIKNYTLYPNGLDYTYNFVKGVNLVLGGNGMGKTTFVNIIKFGLIGLYKKAKNLTRTYKDKAIVKRLLYPDDYFSARKDDSFNVKGEATVTLGFCIKDNEFVVCRSLDTGRLLSVSVNDEYLEGRIIDECRYEQLSEKDQQQFLLYVYEQKIKFCSNLTFDDLIFFVNEILFFGENHSTVLWNDGIDGGRTDVQTELFNKYFNEPDLDEERQEMQRQARYYDSLARHRSEDMRVITKLVEKINSNAKCGAEASSSSANIVVLKNQVEKIGEELASVHARQKGLNNEISILQGEINRSSIQASKLDAEKKRIEREMNASLWETLHPLYDTFIRNIQLNHLCPMCSQESMPLVEKVNGSPMHCFSCGNEIHKVADEKLTAKYKTVTAEHKRIYQSIANKQHRIHSIEDVLSKLDNDFRDKDLNRRALQQQVRELEYQRSIQPEADKLQSLDDERNRLAKEKDEYLKKSDACAKKAQLLTEKIEEEILSNVSRFSAIFASYAGHFLGVHCSLEYAKYDNDNTKRFYPIIDGKVRRQEESLSESQRFFIDHSFRMSILTFFYQTPSFYIVETPDSSLDLSYEQNAAGVFLQFLTKPNIVIVTSNLNNSSFVNYLTSDKNVPVSMVGLPDIAKKSAIQGSNGKMQFIYNDIKGRM